MTEAAILAIGEIIGGIGTFVFFCYIFFGEIPILGPWLKQRHVEKMADIEARRLEAQARITSNDRNRDYIERGS